jgi:hypothetical protein
MATGLQMPGCPVDPFADFAGFHLLDFAHLRDRIELLLRGLFLPRGFRPLGHILPQGGSVF